MFLPVFYIDGESLGFISDICHKYGCKPSDALKGALLFALDYGFRYPVRFANYCVPDTK